MFGESLLERWARALSNLKVDWPLLAGIVLIFAVGEAVLYSASGPGYGIVLRQGLKFLFAIGVMLLVAQIPPRHLKRISPFVYLFGVVLLIGVLVHGHSALGARRWLDLGPLRVQPSEFMKLALPMMLAWLISRNPLPVRFGVLLQVLLLLAIPAVLIDKEPDLGTALIIAMGGVIMIVLAGTRWRYLLFGALICAALMPVAWHFMHAYQRERILVFLNPASAPLGAGYHIVQSMISIGSSGLYGLGWPHAPQAQLGFLPESRTDFIFAVFSEEFGLLGSLALLGAYTFVIMRGLYIAWCASDNYSRLLAGCLSLVFAIDVFINIDMTMGLLPVVGVPLPFMSYGGTSLVSMAAAMGMLQSIARHKPLVAS
ncbi:rod shape-determining protein RodA [Acidihalobacter ferrooxydans]|uniref:Peptidoglycan glycosyltransferase MrdB n=1 Tax=Acidihalobacter ferrooxydans TaxID=1765967 RepID=A0A1P8UDV8_9GAMM|nr:rod shape-determining protein RodA [Acidihalobacter ferrooxydans]APZ42035.1 rod shape-determining protein RodA [Acidihalobacter ferrooxydans]